MQAHTLLGTALVLSSVALFDGCRAPVAAPQAAQGTLTIRLNIEGDPKLVQKFSLLLQAELLGTGYSITDYDNADAVLKGELKYESSTTDYGILAIHQQLSWNGETRSVASCDEAFGGFDEASKRPAPTDLSNASNVAALAKRTFPQARFISVDPASNFRAGPGFPEALNKAFLEQKLIPSQPLPDAIHDLITVEVVKAPVTGDMITYKLEVSGKVSYFNESGNGDLEHRTRMPYPPYCPNQVDPFPDTSDPLANLAFRIARSFHASSTP